jgi:DNA-binding response OmpR family regulator
MTADTTIVLANHQGPETVWIKRDLEAEGFQILAAKDGASALNLLRSEAPSLLVMGWVPPAECSPDDAAQAHMDSFQLLRQVRLQSHVGVIVLSRERSEAVKLYFLDSGADDYLTWPYNRRELLARVRAIVRRTHDSVKGSPTAQGMPTRNGPARQQPGRHLNARDATSSSR